jgi:O-antigen ligase
MLRRVLFILVTGLIVARPVVLGEDPGMQSDFADTTGLVFTFLWLVAACAWAALSLWAGRTGGAMAGRGFGVVEVAFLVLVLLQFASATFAARYKHPALLIAWEWVGMFLAFFLVQKLAVTRREQDCLFAALLASALSLSVYALYQYVVELPLMRQQLGSLEKMLAERNVAPTEEMLEGIRRRATDSHIFGTYAHPNSFAGYLALFLPGLVGAAVVSRLQRSATWQTILAAGAALLGVVALWLTHSRGAILASLVAALFAGGVVGRRFVRRHPFAVLAGILALAGAAYGVSRTGLFTAGVRKEEGTVTLRLQYWKATWKMIEARPWLGVGPGNFGDNYTRFMAPEAWEKIKDPHNLLLEVWATSGLVALLALVVLLVAFFVAVGKGLFSREPGASAGALAPGSRLNEADAPVPWEFYVGGMFGLLLAFLLRAQDPMMDLIGEAVAAGLRSVVWFASFALFERLAWSDRGRTLALTTGVVALLLNLCVSGGISQPAVAGLLWVAVALALNSARPTPVAAGGRRPLARALPLPVLAALTVFYFVYIFYPVTTAANLMGTALRYGREFLSGAVRMDYRNVKRLVIERLEQAAREDPGNARICITLANWYGRLWFTYPLVEQDIPRAIDWARKAQELDPDSRGGYQAEYQVHLMVAGRIPPPTWPGMAAGPAYRLLVEEHPDALLNARQRKVVQEQHHLAGDALARYASRDPTDASLYYQLAEAYARAGDSDRARQAAERALADDRASTRPTRKLNDQQHQQAERWAGVRPGR